MREKAILDLLSKNEYIKLDQMAKKIGVSSRTIRNDLQALSGEGFGVTLSKGIGYHLEVYDEMKFKKYLKEIANTEIEMQDSRLDSLLVLLLLNEDYQTVREFSDLFSVSPSQIKKDLNMLEENLKTSSLIIERKAHYGIRIMGDWEDRLFLLLEKYHQKNPRLVRIMKEQFSLEQHKELKRVIYQELKKKKLHLTYNELENFEVEILLSIIIARKRKGDVLDKENDLLSEIVTQAGMGNVLDKKETEYLLKSLKAKTKTLAFNNIQKERLNLEIINFFKQIDQKYQTSFNEDFEFLKLFYLHVSALIGRLQRKISFSNPDPYIKEISKTYPNEFNFALLFARWLEDKYQLFVNPEELVFLATHIAASFEKQNQKVIKKIYKVGVICSSGGGTAFLIELKLRRILPETEIRTFSMFDIEKVEAFCPDLIFSITELDHSFNCPVVLINEIQDDLDYLELYDHIQFMNLMECFSDIDEVFLSLLDENYFKVVRERKNYREILAQMAEKIECTAAWKGYKKSLLERESFLSTVYQNGVAIPHPIQMCGERNLLSVCVLPNGTETDKEPRIVFMVSLKKNQLELHQLISKYLSKLMASAYKVNSLVNCEDYQEFIFILKRVLGGKS